MRRRAVCGGRGAGGPGPCSAAAHVLRKTCVRARPPSWERPGWPLGGRALGGAGRLPPGSARTWGRPDKGLRSVRSWGPATGSPGNPGAPRRTTWWESGRGVPWGGGLCLGPGLRTSDAQMLRVPSDGSEMGPKLPDQDAELHPVFQRSTPRSRKVGTASMSTHGGYKQDEKAYAAAGRGAANGLGATERGG